jgi:hypothetical protein
MATSIRSVASSSKQLHRRCLTERGGLSTGRPSFREMLRFPTISLTAVLAATVGLCGCGSGAALAPTSATTSEQTQAVRSVVIRFGEAMGRGAGAQACSFLDQNAQQQVIAAAPTKTGTRSPAAACAAILEQVAAEMTQQQRATLEHLRVGQVTITGETANIDPSQVSGPAGSSWIENSQSSSAISLEQSANTWLLDNLG